MEPDGESTDEPGRIYPRLTPDEQRRMFDEVRVSLVWDRVYRERGLRKRAASPKRRPLMPLKAPFMDALRMAAEIHQSQVRKGTDIAYIGHLMAVCALVIQAGGDEDEAIAALLHDALEDTGLSAREIRERYGERVLEIVQGCSDGLPEADSGAERRGSPDRGPDNWFERKARYHEHLRTADPSVLKVSCADKIDNARALVTDVRRLGEELWERFNAGRDAQLWNYRTLAEVFAVRREDLGPEAAWLADELGRQVAELERAVEEGTSEPSVGPTAS